MSQRPIPASSHSSRSAYSRHRPMPPPREFSGQPSTSGIISKSRFPQLSHDRKTTPKGTKRLKTSGSNSRSEAESQAPSSKSLGASAKAKPTDERFVDVPRLQLTHIALPPEHHVLTLDKYRVQASQSARNWTPTDAFKELSKLRKRLEVPEPSDLPNLHELPDIDARHEGGQLSGTKMERLVTQRRRHYLKGILTERHDLRQLHAAEELMSNRRDADGWLHPSERCLHWAELKARQEEELLRAEHTEQQDILRQRHWEMCDRWSQICAAKLQFFQRTAKKVVRELRATQVAGAVKIQTRARGIFARAKVREIRKERFRMMQVAATMIQSIFRGLRDRSYSRFMKKMKMDGTTHETLFEATRLFRNFDKSCRGLLDFEDIQAALGVTGITITIPGVQELLQDLDEYSNFRRSGGKTVCFSDFCSLLQISAGKASCEKMQKALNVFQQFDQDKSGLIDDEELKLACTEMINYTGKQVVDSDVVNAKRGGERFGGVTFELFVTLFGVDTGAAEAELDDKVEAAWQVFQQIDEDGSGRIDFDEMAEGIKFLDENFTDEDCRVMFEDVECDNEGLIDFLEFCKFVGIHNIPPRLSERYIMARQTSHNLGGGHVSRRGSRHKLDTRGSWLVRHSLPSPLPRVQSGEAMEEKWVPPKVGTNECRAIVGIRVMQTEACKTYMKADRGLGKIIMTAHNGQRALVQHADGSERYYYSGHSGKYDLQLCHITECQDEVEEDCFFLAQPHVAKSSVRGKVIDLPPVSMARRYSRFDHLQESLRIIEFQKIKERRGSKNLTAIEQQRKDVLYAQYSMQGHAANLQRASLGSANPSADTARTTSTENYRHALEDRRKSMPTSKSTF